ncbi:MAG TPA: GNAT family N-acetyltransferase [Ktedonobacterales bacterium]|nr:GNAT family N-acetyltransferase [Ktedonobacterales bacterium]
MQPDTSTFEIQPLTPDRWEDLEALFGPRGAYGGCWCMFWRVSGARFAEQCARDGAGNKAAFQEVVMRGDVPGLLAYADGKPVGWCAVAPREVYATLERSTTLKRIDDKPVWVITCFFVAHGWRRKAVYIALISAAIDHVRSLGGRLLEAYPTLHKPGMKAPSNAPVYIGLSAAFRITGFVDVERPGNARRVTVRYSIEG